MAFCVSKYQNYAQNCAGLNQRLRHDLQAVKVDGQLSVKTQLSLRHICKSIEPQPGLINQHVALRKQNAAVRVRFVSFVK